MAASGVVGGVLDFSTSIRYFAESRYGCMIKSRCAPTVLHLHSACMCHAY